MQALKEEKRKKKKKEGSIEWRPGLSLNRATPYLNQFSLEVNIFGIIGTVLSIHQPVAEVVFEGAAVRECILRLIHGVPSRTFSTERVSCELRTNASDFSRCCQNSIVHYFRTICVFTFGLVRAAQRLKHELAYLTQFYNVILKICKSYKFFILSLRYSLDIYQF